MKHIKYFLAISLIAVAAIFINSCGKSDSYMAPPAGNDSVPVYTVSIQSMQFQPASVTMVQGGKITWTNMDTEAHTVTSDDGTSFSSGTIPPQGTYSYIADKTGSYPYHCTLHPSMQGTVIVVVK